MNKQQSSDNLGAVCNVSTLCKILGLSRARFYQLQQKGKFPFPVFDIHTRRPFFTRQLQDICLEIRSSGIAYDDTYILFNASQHRLDSSQNKQISKTNKQPVAQNSKIIEVSETLRQMGIQNCTYSDVEVAIKRLHPTESVETIDTGILVGELFRHFRNKP